MLIAQVDYHEYVLIGGQRAVTIKYHETLPFKPRDPFERVVFCYCYIRCAVC
jgi:hypothetical protein